MTQLTAKTNISDTYPNPSNAVARVGFANLWDVVNEASQAAEIAVASAATVNLGGQTSTKLQITGTTGITSFGTTYRGPIFVRFAASLTLTHNATTLVLPGAANVTTVAGQVAVFVPKATGGTADGWVCVSYPPAWVSSSSGAGATGPNGQTIFVSSEGYLGASWTIGRENQTTCTISIASPAVITQPNALIAGQEIFFQTSGALPTGLSADTTYYVSSTGLSTSSYQVSLTRGGASINTSGSQSGAHTAGKAVRGSMTGPLTIASGATLTIPTSQRLVIL